MNFNYNIGELLYQAFGVENPLAFGDGFKGIQVTEDVAEVHRMSYLGTPIIYPLTFKGQAYQIYADNGEMTTVNLANFELPAVTLSTFSRRKNIAETELVAGYGSVKEMYGFSDWQIEIRGLCLADPKHPQAKTAFDQHLKLKAFENVAESIPVLSELYNEKGIDAIVIKEIYFEQLAGKPGTIPFRITAISDRPAELNL